MKNQLRLVRVNIAALGVMWCASTVFGQSGTRYASPAPAATSPRSTPSGYTGQQLRSIRRQDVGQGYSARSLNSITLQQSQARIPYVGQSSFGQSLRGGAAIGLGLGRSSPTRPSSSVSASPTISPYLNLFRDGLGGGDDFNYQTLVRPQLQQQQLNLQLQQQNVELSRRVQSISAQGAYQNPAGATGLSPTGHQTVFGYHGHFYPSAAPRR